MFALPIPLTGISGKVFRFDATMGLLRDARLSATTRLSELACEHGAHHVLGRLSSPGRSISRLSESGISTGFTGICCRETMTAIVQADSGINFFATGCQIMCTSTSRQNPVTAHGDSLVLLPAPLHHRRTLQDPTAYKDGLDLPDGLIRIELAHGTVTRTASPHYAAL
jgi:hypothetical protein